MSASLTWTGTWTPLNFDAVGLPVTGTNQPGLNPPAAWAGMAETGSGTPSFNPGANVKMLFNFNGEQLKTFDLPELEQFVQAVATGYAISYQAAVALINALWVTKMNRESPRVGPGRNLLYAP